MNALSLTDATTPCHDAPPGPVGRTFPVEKPVNLTGTRAAVLGCGSAGGVAAWGLASASVTALDLADRDRLEPANLRRHVCGDVDLGRPKADAVAEFLRARFPRLTASPHGFCFLERPDLLRGLIERCDIALVAVDDEAPKHLIDAMARELSRPVVYAGVYGGGWGAEAVLIDPAAGSPCYACTARALGRVGVPAPRPAVADYALPNPAADPSDWVRADLTSILPCAALAARLAIAWLSRQRGSAQGWREFHGVGVYAWRLALRSVPAWGFGPWELRPVPVRRLPGCPECEARPASLADLDRMLQGDLL